MGNATGEAKGASYDAVGRYQQDEINGFSRELIDELLVSADVAGVKAVLDAMSGDGNLTARLHAFCKERGIDFPKTTALEFSRVQTEFAKERLGSLGASAMWGDALSMTDRHDGRPLPDGAFDRVLVKSSNHEIPLPQQSQLYRSIFRVLRPSGLFVNLGFLFDSIQERDELRAIARVKDTLAGMDAAARDRYFLTREEFYGLLREAGFVDVRAVRAVDYRIRSQVVAEQYFKPEVRLAGDLEHQAAQAKAFALRRCGRIRFEGTSSLMLCPGEITIARRPSLADTNARLFRDYPMDFLRHIRVHAEMLERAARYVPDGAAVLDLGCGIGLLTEHLSSPDIKYLGLDISRGFVEVAARRYADRAGVSFRVADIMAEETREQFDVVTLLNTLHLPGLGAPELLRKAHRTLRPGGRVIVSGPTSSGSFRSVEDEIVRQLEKDGKLKGNEGQLEALREADRKILTENGYYCSAEGMAALLRHSGFSKVTQAQNDLYHGASYFVVAVK